MNISQHYSNVINEIINNTIIDNNIFVLKGVDNTLINQSFDHYITDHKTFYSNIHTDFSKDWFNHFFTKLNNQQNTQLISYVQLTYLFNYLDPDFFMDRLIVIEDNLKLLFPLDRNLYHEKIEEENIEKRSSNIPLHHAEQLKINGKYYYSLKSLSQEIETKKIHNKEKELKISKTTNNYKVIDISNLYEIDIFIDNIINGTQDPFALVKQHKKLIEKEYLMTIARKVNAFLEIIGGEIYFEKHLSIKEEYEPSKESKKELSEFWGENADFRNLSVYQNPNLNKNVVEISQGLIVDTIINEYENAKALRDVRDLFLTAPTGAGKSLLFQLPSFYISKKGDVTIIVSPLIALMKDQVEAIITDRNFNKVAYINSELSLVDRERIIENCIDGHIDILYMSPELLLSYDISHFIGERNLGLLVIDEAHLITTWGRDFRVDYWFLGNHIRKIRKYKKIQFPMVAVTATAIYGGSNDMVFDSIDSLVMSNPHIYIGQVKRNDIEFVINNHEGFTNQYEKNKLNQTVSFIKELSQLGLKSLVYTPYSKHVKQILSELGSEPIANGYYGALDPHSKEMSYKEFKQGVKNIMVSTKAFGMGVDISDIQVVYHHAPSGLLPDFVQEIGRVARDSEIKGYAALNYSTQDQRFSKALHGMSALRQNQLREVLQKIFKSYLKNKSRNLLLAIDDFGHIFENSNDIDQKVLTALMMIEKDYLAKNRFNVLIARPKKLFVLVYAKVKAIDFTHLKHKYLKSIRKITNLHDNVIIEIDLNQIWLEDFNDISFPLLKRKFYFGKLFKELNVEAIPQLKISYERVIDFNQASSILTSFFKTLNQVFENLGNRFFKQEEFSQKLNFYFKNDIKSDKLSKFILNTFSGIIKITGSIEDGAFIQKRKEGSTFKYRIYNKRFLNTFSSIEKKFNILFKNVGESVVSKYITKKESNSVNYVRLGYFLELLEIGVFEIKGGESPMLFIRINDPQRIEKDSKDKYYKNTLLEKTLERHYLSNQIFDHFFLNGFENGERWNFIEDFFLGESIDELIEQYPENEQNDVNIIDYLKKISKKNNIKKNKVIKKENNLPIFKAKPNQYYKMDNLLTIEISGNNQTMKVSEWLNHNPIAFDMEKRSHQFKIDTDVFKLLSNKLKINHYGYFKKIMGLDLKIDFKGYDSLVKAIVPYKDKPVDFYKWWIKNEDKIYLSTKNKILLFDKVLMMNPNKLKKEHLKLIRK